jgi:tRNA (cytidine/uridine-2'-O-)-methyltransferase
MFRIVLVAPEIPPNTGNVIRLAANTGCALHLVEPLGFSMEDKLMRRAGLDYHEYAEVRRHASGPPCWKPNGPTRRACSPSPPAAPAPCTTWLSRPATGWCSDPNRRAAARRARSLPARAATAAADAAGQRSLNLSNAVAVTVFEAWRQNGFRPASA